MANGDVQQITDSYLQQFNRSISVSAMQKLQQFPALQVLGYNGQLASMKKDFHGLNDFRDQMAKYSSVSHTLRIAWSIIQYMVPINASILALLFTSPSLGTVGNAFKSINGFGQVFALSPADLQSPATVDAKASLYQNASSSGSVVTQGS